MSSGAMQSNVGNPQVYNDGDQRNDEQQNVQRESYNVTFNSNIHDIHDPKDSLTVDKRAEIEKKMEQHEEGKVSKYERDPTLAAKEHGNDPSRGAEIDAELAEDDRRTLEKKGISVE